MFKVLAWSTRHALVYAAIHFLPNPILYVCKEMYDNLFRNPCWNALAGPSRNLLARRLQKNIRGRLAGRGAPCKRPVKRRALEGSLLGYLVGSHKEPGGARCGGPQGAWGSSLKEPTRSLGELVEGAHKEPGGAR